MKKYRAYIHDGSNNDRKHLVTFRPSHHYQVWADTYKELKAKIKRMLQRYPQYADVSIRNTRAKDMSKNPLCIGYARVGDQYVCIFSQKFK